MRARLIIEVAQREVELSLERPETYSDKSNHEEAIVCALDLVAQAARALNVQDAPCDAEAPRLTVSGQPARCVKLHGHPMPHLAVDGMTWEPR